MTGRRRRKTQIFVTSEGSPQLNLLVFPQAKEKGLFAMEGLWTRFFPIIEKARQLVATGAIGASGAPIIGCLMYITRSLAINPMPCPDGLCGESSASASKWGLSAFALRCLAPFLSCVVTVTN
jgi:hypothetical protein